MRVCALIAAKNEAVAIVSTIDSIISAGVDEKDIYLVSDGSTDDTAPLAAERGINVLELAVNGGKSLAIAKGIKHFNLASYDLLALADADTTFEPGYFAAMVRAFEKFPNAAIACGKVKSRPKNWLTAWRALQYAVGHWLIKEGQHASGNDQRRSRLLLRFSHEPVRSGLGKQTKHCRRYDGNASRP